MIEVLFFETTCSCLFLSEFESDYLVIIVNKAKRLFPRSLSKFSGGAQVAATVEVSSRSLSKANCRYKFSVEIDASTVEFIVGSDTRI